jgi:hypothetical protein
MSDTAKVESKHCGKFAGVYETGESSVRGPGASNRLNVDPEDMKNGLAQLVLTLVKLLHELMERQAIERMEGGSLSDEEIEALGVSLMKQAEEIERLREAFGLDEKDLNLDLGPLGKLL